MSIFKIFKKKKELSLIEKARMLGVNIGKNCSFVGGMPIFGSEPYFITIGNNVRISHNVTLLTHDGSARICNNLFKTDYKKFGTITIGDNVFIGCCSIIMPNIKIGNNCIIGAGSVVTKNIPDNEVWAGNPARFIKTIFEYNEQIKKLNNIPKHKELINYVNKVRN